MVAWDRDPRKNVMKLNNTYFFMRHGQTIYQKEKRGINYKSEENLSLPLTDEGMQMAKESAEKLKSENINIIFSSPYLRTKQTAEITAKILDIENINYDERLVDIDLGEFMGRPSEESKKFYFGSTKSFDNRPKGGESWNDVLTRVKSFLTELEEKYKDKNILIVSHADPIWLMTGYLKGIEKPEELVEANKEGCLHPRLAQVIKA